LLLSDLMEKDAGLEVTGKAEYSFHSNNLDQNTSRLPWSIYSVT